MANVVSQRETRYAVHPVLKKECESKNSDANNKTNGIFKRDFRFFRMNQMNAVVVVVNA